MGFVTNGVLLLLCSSLREERVDVGSTLVCCCNDGAGVLRVPNSAILNYVELCSKFTLTTLKIWTNSNPPPESVLVSA
jgi:hypothetical protein